MALAHGTRQAEKLRPLHPRAARRSPALSQQASVCAGSGSQGRAGGWGQGREGGEGPTPPIGQVRPGRSRGRDWEGPALEPLIGRGGAELRRAWHGVAYHWSGQGGEGRGLDRRLSLAKAQPAASTLAISRPLFLADSWGCCGPPRSSVSAVGAEFQGPHFSVPTSNKVRLTVLPPQSFSFLPFSTVPILLLSPPFFLLLFALRSYSFGFLLSIPSLSSFFFVFVPFLITPSSSSPVSFYQQCYLTPVPKLHKKAGFLGSNTSPAT